MEEQQHLEEKLPVDPYSVTRRNSWSKGHFHYFQTMLLLNASYGILHVSGFLVLFLVLKAAAWMVMPISSSELAAFFLF